MLRCSAVVERGLCRRRVTVERPQVQLHGDRRPRGERGQGLHKPPLISSGGRSRGRVGESRRSQCPPVRRLGQQRPGSVAFGVARQLDQHRQRDEVLLGAVVQITFEAAPFFVGRGEQPGARCGKLGGVFGELSSDVRNAAALFQTITMT